MRRGIVVGYNDAGSIEAGRHEVSILRAQPSLAKYKPLRIYLPYGISKLDDGTEILFNRDYCPLWSRSMSGTVLEADPKVTLNLHTAKYLFSDRNAPYTRNGSSNLQKCLEILHEWDVTDQHHNILDRFKEAVRRQSIEHIVPDRFS